MSEPATDSSPTKSRWRNPVFVLVFVLGAGVWLTVVGWLTWMYFNPVTDWIGRQHATLQEILGTALGLGWLVVFVWGLAGIATLAERAAGLPPISANQTHGHGAWRKPN